MPLDGFMTLVPSTRGSIFADAQFEASDSRILRGANVFFEDASTNYNVEMDSITLQVYDANGVEQYTLTTASSPAIELEEPAVVYVVDEIDVSGFPDGDITLLWTGTEDGYEYTYEYTVPFQDAPAMVFVSGLTDTMEDHTLVLGQPKTFTIRLRDSLNQATDGYDVRMAIYDRLNASVVQHISGSLQYTGSGLWALTTTISSPTLAADLERYEIYWDVQLSESGSWFEVANSRHPLKVYQLTTDVTTGPLDYVSNDVIRRTFPNVDELLMSLNPNQGEREILLINKRHEASLLIYSQVKNSRVRANHELLQIWAAYETYRLILITAHAFAKFAIEDGQLKMLDQQIKRLKSTIFSPVSTIRIGGRVGW